MDDISPPWLFLLADLSQHVHQSIYQFQLKHNLSIRPFMVGRNFQVLEVTEPKQIIYSVNFHG